jgi:ABC-type multidrug transport system fused ATPase/permease subunit
MNEEQKERKLAYLRSQKENPTGNYRKYLVNIYNYISKDSLVDGRGWSRAYTRDMLEYVYEGQPDHMGYDRSHANLLFHAFYAILLIDLGALTSLVSVGYWGSRGREFKSHHSDQRKPVIPMIAGFRLYGVNHGSVYKADFTPVCGRIIKLLLLCAATLLVTFAVHRLRYNSVFISVYSESATRRITLAEKLRKRPLSFFGKRDLSDLTSTIMSDCESLEHAFSHVIPQFVGTPLFAVFVTAGMFFLDWRLGLAARSWDTDGGRLCWAESTFQA